MSDKAKILVIDDEHSVRWAFEKALQKANYEVALADNGLKGLNLYYEFKPDITFVDIRMPEMDGLQILEKVMADDPKALIIVMTAYSDMETTVNAMKLGAYDFLTKPFNIDECLSLISRGLTARNSNKVAELGVQAPKSSALKGNSAAMQEVYKLIGKVSGEDVSVLVCGESGCGKELVAQAIHFNSRRSSKPFWPINCTAISESLMESEFFGYEKGAFTGAATSKQGMFELAQGGTIFLDEIGDMPLEMQAKLLRVLEEREIVRVGGNKRISVDVRVIAATNKDLRKLIFEGKFREDLYHRIKVIEIKLPPLRERVEDIPLLAKYFCSILAAQRRGVPKSMSDEAIKLLCEYSWPGNVRELRNAIEQSYTLSRDQLILPEHLPIEITKGVTVTPSVKSVSTSNIQVIIPEDNASAENTDSGNVGDSTSMNESNTILNQNSSETPEDVAVKMLIKRLLDRAPEGDAYSYVLGVFEKELLLQSLEKHKRNQVQSASQLGITRNTLRTKMEKYHL